LVAWWLAALVLPDGRPSFASIAAVVSLGVSYGQRGRKAFELVGGVVLGIAVAAVIVPIIGTGAWQIGLMVVLAMSTAVVLGGSELVISEAGVSAILIVALTPGAESHYTLTRITEAVIGGGVSLLITALFLAPDATQHVGRAADSLFDTLSATLAKLAGALRDGDPDAAAVALTDARNLDPTVGAYAQQIDEMREIARLTPRRRSTLAELDRYGASFTQIDYAVRDTRVLARHALRTLRAGDPLPPRLGEAVQELSRSVQELGRSFADPERIEAARGHALRASAIAQELADVTQPTALEVIGQIRSTAVDLRRASDIVDDDEPFARSEAPTEELLIGV